MADVADSYVEVSGSYGELPGGIYIYDTDGEVVMWDSSEWEEDPSLVFVIASAIREALTLGTGDMRLRIGHLAPEPPFSMFNHWMKPPQAALIAEWERGKDLPTFFDERGIERTADWWFGFPPTSEKEDIWHWVDDRLDNGLAVDVFGEQPKE